jgi:multisubunit Na+/H+ antiporter MnhB subunit
MIFTTSLLLLLMHCGAAIVMTIANSFESVKRGEIAESTAWLVSIGCGVLGLALAVFVAFCAVSFVEFVATDAAAGAPPPHPKRRTLRLVA